MSFLLLTLCVALAPADDAAFEAAQAQYQAMDVEGAQKSFADLAASETDPTQKAAILVWLGLTQAELGAFEDADTAFTEAFQYDPNAALPVDVSPKIRDRFEALRADAALPPAANDDDDDDDGFDMNTALLGTGLGFLAATVIAGAVAGAGWLVAVALYQGAVANPNADDAQRTYFIAQGFAWAGNGMMAVAVLTLIGGSVATGGWAFLAATAE